MHPNKLLAVFFIASLALGTYVMRTNLPAEGVFLVDPHATLFWGGYAAVPLAVASLTTLGESAGRLALLAACQLLGTELALYGGAVSFFFYGPRSSYLPAFVLAVLNAAPAAYRLKRVARPHAPAALAAALAAVGPALAHVAGGVDAVAPVERYVVFTGVFQVLAAAAAAFADWTRQPRAERVGGAALALAGTFSLVSACVTGAQGAHNPRRGLESLLSSMCALCALTLWAAARRPAPPAAPDEESAPQPAPTPPAAPSRSRREALLKEAAEAEAAEPPPRRPAGRTRAQELVRYSETVEAIEAAVSRV